MAIEWVPRSPTGKGVWRSADGSPWVPPPAGVEVAGQRGVRVPVGASPPAGSRRRSGRSGRSGLGGWVGLVLLVNLGHVINAARTMSMSLWATLTSSAWLPVMLALLLLVTVYRWLRLRPLTGRAHTADLVLTPAGLETGGLVVPWTSVSAVERFGFAAGPGRGGPGSRHFLAVRVDDFVNVRGLTPFRAGLANLTRRHLVVLCESREVHDPTALSLALTELVANPVARELLSGHEGVRLVSTGPPRSPGTP